jgi:hypothetical protein
MCAGSFSSSFSFSFSPLWLDIPSEDLSCLFFPHLSVVASQISL